MLRTNKTGHSPKYEDIRSGILKEINGLDKREGSFICDMVAPIAMEMERQYQELEKTKGIMFLETSIGDYIDMRGSEYGIIRKDGTKAIGTVVFTGNPNIVIPRGSYVAAFGGVVFSTDKDVTTGSSGSIMVGITSLEIGAKNNIYSGGITIIPVAMLGITSVHNTLPTLGGTDRETDIELRDRILFFIRNPATSGNVHHYRNWTMEVDGVGDARIFPLMNGPGSVGVMIVSGYHSATPALIDKVSNYIESRRPIGANVTVFTATHVPIVVVADISLDPMAIMDDVIALYTQALEEYIFQSVLRRNIVDYYKCLSFFYDIPLVNGVDQFTINGGTSSISIEDKEIQVMESITIRRQT